jgi:diacylglycerol kinase (ATP)
VYEGTHVDHPLVQTFRARTVELACEDIVAYADGERICPLPIAITCMPGALRLVGPAPEPPGR